MYPNKLYQQVLKGVCKNIVDGDTIDISINMDLGFHSHAVLKPRVRLARIDAPELRGKERPYGIAAKKWLLEQLIDQDGNPKLLHVRTFKDDSFGRWVAEVSVKTPSKYENISDLMVAAGHAVYKEY